MAPKLPSLVIASLLVLSACASNTMNNTDLAKEFYNLGSAYYDLKKYKEASGFYSRALSLDPSLNQAGYNLARAQAESGDLDGAAANLGGLLTLDPSNLLLKKTLAYIRYLQDHKTDALALYAEVLKTSPGDADSLYNAGLVAAGLNQNQDALTYLEAYLALGNKGPEVYRLLADVYQKLDLKDKAITTLEALTATDTSNRLALATLADLQESAKHWDKVLEALFKLEALGGSSTGKADPALLYRIAVVELTQIQDETKALDYFGKAIEAGFNDKDKVKALLETADLYRKDKVTAWFKDRKFFEKPADTKSADPKPTDPKPTDAKTAEPKATDPKPAAPTTPPAPVAPSTNPTPPGDKKS